MNHPELILRTLDRHLSRPTRLILYGRAALALGFVDVPDAFGATFDVDAILPRVEMSTIEEDDQFWLALEKANEELEPGGLYITHLFADDQVILSPDWMMHRVDIGLADLCHLSLQRPSTEDLILTKMMRVDPQDREDILFLLSRLPVPSTRLAEILESPGIPDIPEIATAYASNREWLRTVAGV
jgi:hypothetical protein